MHPDKHWVRRSHVIHPIGSDMNRMSGMNMNAQLQGSGWDGIMMVHIAAFLNFFVYHSLPIVSRLISLIRILLLTEAGVRVQVEDIEASGMATKPSPGS